MFYIEKDNEIKLADNDIEKIQNTILFMPELKDLEIKESEVDIDYIDDKFYFVNDPIYIAKKEQAERERLDLMTLTPADVERALVDAKDMDFDDLKKLITEKMTGINIKRLGAEFRAKDFYRGAIYEGRRLFDIIGALLGYTPADMDYLFLNKRLPEDINDEVNNED